VRTTRFFFFGTILLFLITAPPVHAADGDWLLAFPVDDGHRAYGRVIGQLAAQSLVDPNSRGTNVVESYRCISLSTWGFSSETFSFSKTSNSETTNQSSWECTWEVKEWSGRSGHTNTPVVILHGVLNGATALELLTKLQQQEVFSHSGIVRAEFPDRSKPFVVTADASDLIIERWSKMSYLCIMRPGLYETHHEESVRKFARFCYETSTKLESEQHKR
jgi:hypothetical protein